MHQEHATTVSSYTVRIRRPRITINVGSWTDRAGSDRRGTGPGPTGLTDHQNMFNVTSNMCSVSYPGKHNTTSRPSDRKPTPQHDDGAVSYVISVNAANVTVNSYVNVKAAPCVSIM